MKKGIFSRLGNDRGVSSAIVVIMLTVVGIAIASMAIALMKGMAVSLNETASRKFEKTLDELEDF